MRARLVPSRRLALLFILALGALLGVVLFAESARVPLRTPLVPRASRASPLSVPLDGRETRRASTLFRLELVAREPAELLAHEELHLFLESVPKGRALVAARLQLRGSDCALVATGREELTSQQPTVLRRSAECRPRDLPGPVALDLEVEVKGDGGVSLLAFVPATDTPAPLQITPSRTRPTPLDVRGAFVDYPATAPRIVLLNHMWRIAPGVGWLAGLVGLAIAIACAGCLVFPTRPATDSRFWPATVTILRGVAGAALFATSLTLLHAVLDPPLSGPDEPYHLLGFADLVKDEALAEDTIAWMGETHLWRIRQQPGERFRTIDVGQPYVVEDDQLRPTEVAMRSAILARTWRAVAPVVRGQPAPRALLALRILNGLVFALAVGAASALALALVAEPLPQWLVFPFLFVPSLPFFAMHVSETAILCSVYVLLGASLAVVSLDGPRAHWAGLPLGLATGLMLAGGRSPWPLTVLVSAILLGRVLLGPRGSRREIRDALVFWGGLGLGAAVFFLALDDAYRMMTETYAIYFTRFVPEGLRGLGLWLLAHPSVATSLVLCGATLEVVLGPLRTRLAARLEPDARRIVPLVANALAAAVILSLLGSLFFAYPQLPLQPLAAPERLGAVLRTMATMFRLTEPNFSLASSFWVGFGWLDTMPRPALQGLLTALVGLALAMRLRHIARYRQVRRFLWMLLVAAGAVAALVLYTLSTQDKVTALQGRYLIGWYLAVLAVIGGALVLDHRAPMDTGDPPGSEGSTRAAFLLVVAGAVHVYCLSFILKRYF